MNSHYEILWADNSGENLGHQPTSNYAARLDEAEKQAIIYQQRLSSNVLGLWIKNYLTTNAKHKIRDFESAYTFNDQYDGAATIFVILKIVQPDTLTGWSDIQYNLEILRCPISNMTPPNPNYVMNEISIAGETYS